MSESEQYAAPAIPEKPAAPALRLLWCAMCLQDKVDREAARLDPLPVHPAVTIVGGNAICNVKGRHQIVASQSAAVLLQPGRQMPPPPFGRRAG